MHLRTYPPHFSDPKEKQCTGYPCGLVTKFHLRFDTQTEVLETCYRLYDLGIGTVGK